MKLLLWPSCTFFWSKCPSFLLTHFKNKGHKRKYILYYFHFKFLSTTFSFVPQSFLPPLFFTLSFHFFFTLAKSNGYNTGLHFFFTVLVIFLLYILLHLSSFFKYLFLHKRYWRGGFFLQCQSTMKI